VKKLISIIIAVVMILSTTITAFAGTVGSQANVAVGGGKIPDVKCKWEQQPVQVFKELEDADPLHKTNGFQLLPPVKAGAMKMIEYYAVVTDEEDGGDLSQVFADVYHPVGSPEPYGPSKIGGVLYYPYFKYEIPYRDLQTGEGAISKDAAISIVNYAYARKLITFNKEYPIAEVIYELDKGTAHLWMGWAYIDYEQPAGKYDVYVWAVDTNNNPSIVLYNQFTYVAIAGIEVDFTSIDWGSVNLGKEKMIPGDLTWNSPAGINNATVRNIGNTFVSVQIGFSDMGFGQDVNGNWNVLFDARMGSDDQYYVGSIEPFAWYTLPNALNLSCKDELDLSILIIKGFGAHKGKITLGAVARPFDYKDVDGFSARGDYSPTYDWPINQG